MKTHWLYREGSVRKLWYAGAAVLASTVLAQILVPLHGHFGFDAWFGFPAFYGFVTCVAMVLFAKVLGFAVKRRDDYYDG